MKLLLIIPCYNEEKNILKVITEIRNKYCEYDYIVINDGSSDNSEKVLRKYNINHISHLVNCGLAVTFQTGIKWALQQEVHYDAVCQFDADGQHLPYYLPQMLNTLYDTEVDIVIGSRMKKGGQNVFEGISKRICQRILSDIIWYFTKNRITDPTSGFRMYKDTVYNIFATENIVTPEPDGIVYLLKHNFIVKEIPVQMKEREYGESYLTITKAIKYMANIISSIIFIQWWKK